MYKFPSLFVIIAITLCTGCSALGELLTSVYKESCILKRHRCDT